MRLMQSLPTSPSVLTPASAVAPGSESRLFDELRFSYTRATGLPLTWQAPGEFGVGEEPSIPDFCRVMAGARKSCSNCLKTHLALQDPGGSRTIKCFAGLTSSALPVVKHGEAVGYLHTGHAYVDRSPGCAMPGKGCLLPGRPAGRHCKCSGACHQTPVLTRDRYEGALDLLRLFSNQLAEVVAPESFGHPAIARAVRRMRGDVAQDWKLASLAASSGMHAGYFSEQFHRHTGSTFTDFLADLRVAHARRLLRFTTLPVSEVAFSSGFRSISQFNRTFKARTGLTPKDARGAG